MEASKQNSVWQLRLITQNWELMPLAMVSRISALRLPISHLPYLLRQSDLESCYMKRTGWYTVQYLGKSLFKERRTNPLKNL
jgi:hypothetical protein